MLMLILLLLKQKTFLDCFYYASNICIYVIVDFCYESKVEAVPK